MYLLRPALIAACLLPLAAWAAPVPADKLAYVGDWQGGDRRLQLSRDGKVKYKREEKSKHKSEKVDLNVDLQGFDGNNFSVGWGIVSLTFVVSKPPHREGDKWKMTVDGVELTRVD
ncbi:hypothetical protein G4G28_01870 [Massilia sp. Dwa41.01b]|uniref:hypothetical protein n=1 Tax=unclassified Massilia TaxID=2609279 RepID=UPI0015FFE4AD|nr:MULTISPECIES: hypothetical protein [unclassified Massilia]QNA87523.1 hypothetical protein G4G28_01870 [Massilia sp. Dwa41.01b]QNA98430.1 hypothetical protein G4G31_05635 [Massilia sp. Se16.2.3]